MDSPNASFKLDRNREKNPWLLLAEAAAACLSAAALARNGSVGTSKGRSRIMTFVSWMWRRYA